MLVQDEFNEHNYGFSSFPSGSKLVYLKDEDTTTNNHFVVENSTGDLLVNVDDLIHHYLVSSNTVRAFKRSDATGLPLTDKQLYIAVLIFDDTGAGGNTHFYMQGLSEALLSTSVHI